MNQSKAPIYEALEKFRKMRIVPFDVTGYKRGRGNPRLVELLREKYVDIDVNSMKRLDNLYHPVSVIKKAEELAADAFGAYYTFGPEFFNKNSIYDFDVTKLSIYTLDIGLAGIEVYDI